VIAAVMAVQRSLALCVVGIVAVIRARREDIPAVMSALAQTLDHPRMLRER
jgi:hypothetical protein